ncbi:MULTISPECIES: DsbA family protein [Dietzia]|nr:MULTISPECIES: thioredoxin domain-containing protein [Dietzia]MCT1713522.1 DsbA family protein [Dietzia cinnamea]MCT2057407.1 DsbA family protein [Dietzia cinnamea]MCT2062982.1 DsbA family protein [Dietzia cinnamea]MCT2097450.1 DsbA family protein [Dietzia cinnamea]MCT2122540.1 DsbA family protein [Dietzia cinnamea]
MSKNLALSLALIGVVGLILAGMLVWNSQDESSPEAVGDEPTAQLVREDSPRLSEGEEAVFVEYLDFECEGCLALYPVIEDLRDKYGDRVEFVVRHMPLHDNSVNAALAAEAAAEQGEFEAMYQRLFDSVDQWGHQSTSQAETFVGYADELGLDVDRFRADVNDPATLASIEQSRQDAQAFGVTGTPTLFLDGQRLEPTSVADLEASIEAALND